MKLEKMTWKDGIALVTGVKYNRLAFHLRRLPKPIRIQGKSHHWEVTFGPVADTDPNRMLRVDRRGWLSAATKADAMAELEKLAKQSAANVKRRLGSTPRLSEMVDKAQWLVLKQVWPGTVKLIQQAQVESDLKKKEALYRQAVAEHKAELFFRTHILEQQPADDETMKRIRAARRHKPRDADSDDVLLALNWDAKRYCDMKRKELKAALKTKRSPDTIAKRAERLGLTTSSKVKPGPRGIVEL